MIDVEAYYDNNKFQAIYTLCRDVNQTLCWRESILRWEYSDPPKGALYLPFLEDRRTMAFWREDGAPFHGKNFEESDLLFEADPVN